MLNDVINTCKCHFRLTMTFLFTHVDYFLYYDFENFEFKCKVLSYSLYSLDLIFIVVFVEHEIKEIFN